MTGMLYLFPMSTRRLKLAIVVASVAASPTEIIAAIAAGLRLIASSSARRTLWFISVRIVVPVSVRRQIGLVFSGEMLERIEPRQPMRQSACSARGSILMSIRSRPEVGPMRKPWSKASITVRPDLRLKMRAMRFLIPQSVLLRPLR